MSDTLENLRRKMNGAGELQSLVRTMKVLAAANIGQYERAVRSLADYYRTIELGLAACFREAAPAFEREAPADSRTTGAIVFGSDQGLVGQFNEALAEYVARTLRAVPGKKTVWAVGERIHSRLADVGLSPTATLTVPTSVTAITPLTGRILVETETQRAQGKLAQVYLFHNRPKSGALYEPVSQRLLPLDEKWQSEWSAIQWPTINLPEVMNNTVPTLLALVREYLFVSLFKACAESLASENASRLAAMQRAEKNIGELLEDLGRSFHRLRQSSIDEELFDLISGFEALANGEKPKGTVLRKEELDHDKRTTRNRAA
jgi:F-type H+-transporting ATPase subunit gamma